MKLSLRPATSAVFVLVLLLPFVAQGQTNWQRVDTEEGVEVFQRDAQHMEGIAFRGELVADVHIGKVISVFIDPDERPNWVYRHSEERQLQRDENRQQQWSERYWVRVDMPMPTTDRDYVFETEYEFDHDDKVVFARLRSVEDRRARERDCCVRARSITNYTVEPIEGEEKTRIIVEVETDLGGNLPGWLTRRAEQDWPVETLTALAERAQDDDVPIDERVRDWHE